MFRSWIATQEEQMPHAFRLYKILKQSGFPEEGSLAVASILEDARSADEADAFDREKIADILFDANLLEAQAEAFADVIRNCFFGEKNRCWFDQGKLKVQLVRSGLKADLSDRVLETVGRCVVSPRTAESRLSINLPLRAGQVVMCDFSFLRKPEMQKERRAIVVSDPKTQAAKRCSVVPVSKSVPRNDTLPFVEFVPGSYPFFHRTEPVYAVCDHVYTLSYTRMWQINVGRRPRIPSISPEHLVAVRKAIAKEFGISS